MSIGCVVASARRLLFAIAPTSFDAAILRRAVDDGEREKVRELVASSDWEKDVFEAASLEGEERAARMNEALSEIDHRLAIWSRVPRVCASIASSTGFLCGAMALRVGLAEVDSVPDAGIDSVLHGAVGSALGVAALGIAAAVACVALDSEAKKAVRAKRLAADLLVERLERV
ncbi:MAG: hypothetical protein ACRELY_12700 [Polyangiaceae bacterium]